MKRFIEAAILDPDGRVTEHEGSRRGAAPRDRKDRAVGRAAHDAERGRLDDVACLRPRRADRPHAWWHGLVDALDPQHRHALAVAHLVAAGHSRAHGLRDADALHAASRGRHCRRRHRSHPRPASLVLRRRLLLRCRHRRAGRAPRRVARRAIRDGVARRARIAARRSARHRALAPPRAYGGQACRSQEEPRCVDDRRSQPRRRPRRPDPRDQHRASETGIRADLAWGIAAGMPAAGARQACRHLGRAGPRELALHRGKGARTCTVSRPMPRSSSSTAHRTGFNTKRPSVSTRRCSTSSIVDRSCSPENPDAPRSRPVPRRHRHACRTCCAGANLSIEARARHRAVRAGRRYRRADPRAS